MHVCVCMHVCIYICMCYVYRHVCMCICRHVYDFAQVTWLGIPVHRWMEVVRIEFFTLSSISKNKSIIHHKYTVGCGFLEMPFIRFRQLSSITGLGRACITGKGLVAPAVILHWLSSFFFLLPVTSFSDVKLTMHCWDKLHLVKMHDPFQMLRAHHEEQEWQLSFPLGLHLVLVWGNTDNVKQLGKFPPSFSGRCLLALATYAWPRGYLKPCYLNPWYPETRMRRRLSLQTYWDFYYWFLSNFGGRTMHDLSL